MCACQRAINHWVRKLNVLSSVQLHTAKRLVLLTNTLSEWVSLTINYSLRLLSAGTCAIIINRVRKYPREDSNPDKHRFSLKAGLLPSSISSYSPQLHLTPTTSLRHVRRQFLFRVYISIRASNSWNFFTVPVLRGNPYNAGFSAI